MLTKVTLNVWIDAVFMEHLPLGLHQQFTRSSLKRQKSTLKRRSNNSSSDDTVMATMSTCAGDHCYTNPQFGEAVNELLKDNMPTTQDTGEISRSGNNSRTKTDQLLLTESDISNEDSCSEEMRFFDCDIVNTPSNMPDVTVVVKIEQTNTPLCGECGNEFKTNFGVTIHKFRTQHSFHCHYCSIVFTKYREFRKHIRIHESRPVAQCEICERKFYGRYRDCTQHMKRVHQGQQAALKPTKPQTN